mmetsp:Transcript_21607/g.58113  ORF Transcript_21607/g.58113 Transcript_21607/m.58113 type:complete len:521 (-) Transcript_21607:687-2249(-)
MTARATAVARVRARGGGLGRRRAGLRGLGASWRCGAATGASARAGALARWTCKLCRWSHCVLQLRRLRRGGGGHGRSRKEAAGEREEIVELLSCECGPRGARACSTADATFGITTVSHRANDIFALARSARARCTASDTLVLRPGAAGGYHQAHWREDLAKDASNLLPEHGEGQLPVALSCSRKGAHHEAVRRIGDKRKRIGAHGCCGRGCRGRARPEEHHEVGNQATVSQVAQLGARLVCRHAHVRRCASLLASAQRRGVRVHEPRAPRHRVLEHLAVRRGGEPAERGRSLHGEMRGVHGDGSAERGRRADSHALCSCGVKIHELQRGEHAACAQHLRPVVCRELAERLEHLLRQVDVLGAEEAFAERGGRAQVHEWACGRGEQVHEVAQRPGCEEEQIRVVWGAQQRHEHWCVFVNRKASHEQAFFRSHAEELAELRERGELHSLVSPLSQAREQCAKLTATTNHKATTATQAQAPAGAPPGGGAPTSIGRRRPRGTVEEILERGGWDGIGCSPACGL